MIIQDLERFSPQQYYYNTNDELQRFVFGRSNDAFASGDAERDGLDNIEDLKKRQSTMRAAFIEAIGGLPQMDTPLNPRVIDTIECDGFRIEKIIFESRPCTFVTANLYVPNGITTPRGAVLFVCGHGEQAKHEPVYQTVCRYLVGAGLVVLAQDPVGQGERKSYWEPRFGETVKWGVTEHDYAGSQCLLTGEAIARYFVHDSMRSIDYLLTRPEVDPARIGVTGNSGGGTQTSLLMICDPRIAAAAPGTFIMNRQTYMYVGGSQDAEQVWPRMTVLGFDHEDILLQMCPRPVRVLAVKADFFPIEGTRRTVERCERFWKMYGREDCLDMIEDESVHSYTRVLAKAAAEFFSCHLLEKKISPEDDSIKPIEESKLLCTVSGQVRGEIPGARAVHDEIVDRLSELETQRSALSEAARKDQGLKWLSERVFSDRKPTDLNPRFYHAEPVEELWVEMCLWWSQRHLHNHAYVLRDHRFVGQKIPVTLAVWDEGTNCLHAHMKWIRETCSSGRAVMVLDTSGVGSIEPKSMNDHAVRGLYGTIHHFADDLTWLGDSLAAMRIYDVLRALDVIEMWPTLEIGDIRAYAHGRHGIYARFATALDKRIHSIEVVEGIESYAEWVGARHYDSFDIKSIVLPDLLKYFDLPDLDGYVKELTMLA